jgi:hypothetical protein
MVHRWGLATRVRRRAAVGAAVALALVVLQAGPAVADDPARPKPTPDTAGPAAGAAWPDPAVDLPNLGPPLVPHGDPTPADIPPPAPGAPPAAGAAVPAPAVLDRGVVDLTTCALAAMGCSPSAAARLVWDLLPLVAAPPGQPAMPGAAPPGPGTVASDAPLPTAAAPPPPATSDGVAPPLDAVGLVLGPAFPPAVPPVAPAPARAPAPAAAPLASAGPAAAPALASTGAPVVAALAGLVLLAVGGCLTWARSRS